MLVPEAAVDKEGQTVARQDDVRLPRKITPVQPEPVAEGVQHPAHGDFRTRVGGPYPGHQRTAARIDFWPDGFQRFPYLLNLRFSGEPAKGVMATDIGRSEEEAPAVTVTEEERRFTEDMKAARGSGKAAEAVLHTDDRVLARITDGIYRQPSSALRELISNAYDADATTVYIETDAPRFSQITVRDNGRGMDEEALSRMIHHIGGSSKRTTLGAAVGTTDPANPNLSKGGRRLIGKIGIGLFSVSQLTSHFQIITKIKGQDYRLFADVILKTYSEDGGEEPSDGRYETGKVRVAVHPAEDKDSQGTQIILLDLHPRARDILRSRERWERYLEQLELPEADRDPVITAPIFHSGFLAKEPDPADGELVYRFEPALPWARGDDPLARFEKLHGALASQVGSTSDRPELSRTLDAYLTTL